MEEINKTPKSKKEKAPRSKMKSGIENDYVLIHRILMIGMYAALAVFSLDLLWLVGNQILNALLAGMSLAIMVLLTGNLIIFGVLKNAIDKNKSYTYFALIQLFVVLLITAIYFIIFLQVIKSWETSLKGWACASFIFFLGLIWNIVWIFGYREFRIKIKKLNY